MKYEDRIEEVLEALRPFAEELVNNGVHANDVIMAVAKGRVRIVADDPGKKD